MQRREGGRTESGSGLMQKMTTVHVGVLESRFLKRHSGFTQTPLEFRCIHALHGCFVFLRQRGGAGGLAEHHPVGLDTEGIEGHAGAAEDAGDKEILTIGVALMNQCGQGHEEREEGTNFHGLLDFSPC